MIPLDMACGTIHKTKNHGELEIKEYISSSMVKVRFKLTGFESKAEAGDIRKGNVRDLMFPNVFGVGFCGVGNEPQSIEGIKTKAYSAWYNMMLRCYSKNKPQRYNTYNDCYVCEEWHNFQNFSKWFNENSCIGLELDKDCLIDGNRVYSPDTCLFVSGFKNKSKAREIGYCLISPSGVVFRGVNVTKFCIDNGLSNSNISMVMSGKRKHHKGWRVYSE